LLRSKYYKTWPHHKKKKNLIVHNTETNYFIFLQVLIFVLIYDHRVDQKVKILGKMKGEKQNNSLSREKKGAKISIFKIREKVDFDGKK